MKKSASKHAFSVRVLNLNLSLTPNLSGLESRIKMKIMIKREQA
jgi:hypothetical protein